MFVEYSLISNTDIAKISINELPRKLSESHIHNCCKELREFLVSPDLKGIVIEGIEKWSGEDKQKAELTAFISDNIFTSCIPAVGIIKGNCRGAAMHLALSCHFRFVSQTAVFQWESRYLHKNVCQKLLTGIIRKPEMSGNIMRGTYISAKEGKYAGLVECICQQGNVFEKALDFIVELTEKRSQDQIKSIMYLVNVSDKMARKEALVEEGKRFDSILCNLDRSVFY